MHYLDNLLDKKQKSLSSVRQMRLEMQDQFDINCLLIILGATIVTENEIIYSVVQRRLAEMGHDVDLTYK